MVPTVHVAAMWLREPGLNIPSFINGSAPNFRQGRSCCLPGVSHTRTAGWQLHHALKPHPTSTRPLAVIVRDFCEAARRALPAPAPICGHLDRANPGLQARGNKEVH